MKLADYFKRNDRYARIDSPEPERTFYTLTDDAPEWLTDAVREAHDDEGPNDWRFETCYRIALAIDETEEPADGLDVGDFANTTADSLTDVYTSDLLTWLAGHLGRVSDVDDASDDPKDGIVEVIRYGQYNVIERMTTILAAAYVENVQD